MPDKCKCGKPGIAAINGKGYCVECFAKGMAQLGKIIGETTKTLKEALK